MWNIVWCFERKLSAVFGVMEERGAANKNLLSFPCLPRRSAFGGGHRGSQAAGNLFVYTSGD